jgi:DNA-binding response OmpR family regulator
LPRGSNGPAGEGSKCFASPYPEPIVPRLGRALVARLPDSHHNDGNCNAWGAADRAAAFMRILLIEDDADIARELKLRWQGGPWLVSHVARLENADAALQADAYALVLLDLGMPDGDGISWLQRLRSRDRDIPVIVLTARDRVADRVEGLRAGADDYLVKPYSADELDARIDVVLRRTHPDRDRFIRFGKLSVLADDFGAYVDGEPLELAMREFEVLRMLISRAPRLVPKRVLVDALSIANQEINDTAAELYVSRLRKRLEGTGLEIRTMRGVGYQLAISPQDTVAQAPRPDS